MRAITFEVDTLLGGAITAARPRATSLSKSGSLGVFGTLGGATIICVIVCGRVGLAGIGAAPTGDNGLATGDNGTYDGVAAGAANACGCGALFPRTPAPSSRARFRI
jgi:hypothetical protein